ncbi:tail collar fiber protein [Vibrio phage D480]|nr:short tail fiber protein [Vibrio phage 6E35.1a]
MSGTNIFTHVSDEAQYVYLQPFTSPGKAFETGGDVQSLLEQIHVNALEPLPTLPFATTDEQGSVEYSTQAEANALDDVLTVLTPQSLDGVNTHVSPSTTTQLGNLREVRTSDLTRVTASSDDTRLMSYRRLDEMTSVRNALADDGSVESQGFARHSTLSEALAYNPTNFISPQKTWNLIKTEIPNPWTQATETESGVLRTVGQRDALKSDRTIAITVGGLNHVNATTSKRGAFKITDNNLSRDDEFANEYAITPATIANLIGTETQSGFFSLPTSFADESSEVTSAARGFELGQKLGPDGGVITGTLNCDNIVSKITQSVKKTTSGGGTYYVDETRKRELFPSDHIDREIGLEGRPVGSIFHCTRNVDPNTQFGGVWYRVQGGRTMIGAGTGNDYVRKRSFSAGSQGGNRRERLAEKHLPVHKHASWGETYSTKNSTCIKYEEVRNPYGVTYYCKEYSTVNYWKFGKTGSRNNPGMGSTDSDNYMYYNSPVGGNGYHENMMPYYTVYIWRRVK